MAFFSGLLQRSLRIAPMQIRSFHSANVLAKKVNFSFLQRSGKTVKVSAEEGENLYEVSKNNGLDMEGACEGTCACSTCHVVLPEPLFKALPEPTEDEIDMLDLASNLTETSRLGCQVIVSPKLEGTTIKIVP